MGIFQMINQQKQDALRQAKAHVLVDTINSERHETGYIQVVKKCATERSAVYHWKGPADEQLHVRPPLKGQTKKLMPSRQYESTQVLHLPVRLIDSMHQVPLRAAIRLPVLIGSCNDPLHDLFGFPSHNGPCQRDPSPLRGAYRSDPSPHWGAYPHDSFPPPAHHNNTS